MTAWVLRENFVLNPAEEPTARQPNGIELDRQHPLRFSFDGQAYIGYRGDTLATALLANEVRLGGRSPRYRRPLGVGGRYPLRVRLRYVPPPSTFTEPLAASPGLSRFVRPMGQDAMATIDTETMDDLRLYDGLTARSQHGWPSAAWDMGYDWDRYWTSRSHPSAIQADTGCDYCDVLVIGGGPAGLATAYAAMQQRQRVCLLEGQGHLGGGVRLLPRQIFHYDAREWFRRTESRLRQCATVRLYTNAIGQDAQGTVWGVEKRPFVPHERRQMRLWRIRAKHVVLATGGRSGWINCPRDDLPGVFAFHQAVRYAVGYGLRVGKRAVLYTDTDVDLRDIALLEQMGLEWVGYVDRRRSGPGTELSRWLQLRRIPMYCGNVSVQGMMAVETITIHSPNAPKRLKVDTLLICSRPQKQPATTFRGLLPLEGIGVGVMAGRWVLEDALRHGYAVGQQLGGESKAVRLPMRVREDSPRLPRLQTPTRPDPLATQPLTIPLESLKLMPKPTRTSPLQPFHQLQVREWHNWGPWHWPWRYADESLAAVRTGALIDASALSAGWRETLPEKTPETKATRWLPFQGGYLGYGPVAETAVLAAEGWALLLLTGTSAADALESVLDGMFSPERLKLGCFVVQSIQGQAVGIWRVTFDQQPAYLLAMRATSALAVGLALLGNGEFPLVPIGLMTVQQLRLQRGLLPHHTVPTKGDILPLFAPCLPPLLPPFAWGIVEAAFPFQIDDQLLDSQRREVGEWALICDRWALIRRDKRRIPQWIRCVGERRLRDVRWVNPLP